MAQLKRFDARIAETDQAISMLEIVKLRLNEALDYETQEFKSGIITPLAFAVRLEGMLAGLSAYIGTDIVAALGLLDDNIEVWPAQVSKEIFHDPQIWESVAVAVSAGTLTINQTDSVAIFTTIFANSDVIRISNAEDPRHNGLHVISNVAPQILTVAAMLGEDNATDTSMIITVVER